MALPAWSGSARWVPRRPCPSWSRCTSGTWRPEVSPRARAAVGGDRAGRQAVPRPECRYLADPAGEHATRLSLAGVYRPPLAALGAGLDRAVFHKVADATVRSLLARVADVLARPRSRPTLCREPAGPGGAGRRAVVELP